jgi:lysophospholipase L1-like esterase
MSSDFPLPSRGALWFLQVDGPRKVDIVCVGDSLTGYNNFGSVWPLPTYPDFLQEMLRRDGGLEIVLNGGQAGEWSDGAPSLTRQYLGLFPRSTHFIIGFGTNDLARLDEDEMDATSTTIIEHLGDAIALAEIAGKKVVAFNVPHLNGRLFGKGTVARSRRMREYHNGRLAAFCAAKGIPLADVCSRLADEHFADALHPSAAGTKMVPGGAFR